MDRGLLEHRYHRVREGLPPHVKLIAVSKTRSVDEIRALYDLGHRAFGENYPQELKEKQPQLPGDIEWHFIGNLQTNKVKYIAPFVHLVHTVDGTKLLDELQKHAQRNERELNVLVQVHIAQEETKHGLSPAEAMELLHSWDPHRWSLLRPRGLMGMATNTSDVDQVKREFTGLAALFHRLRNKGAVETSQFTELSMGMSGDSDVAVAAGSTMVRVGSAIFGER